MDRYVERHGPVLRLYSAAKLAPVLSAMFGPREAVTDYRLGQVLMVLDLHGDEAGLSYWSAHFYSKAMERKARNK